MPSWALFLALYVPSPNTTERLYIKTGNITGRWVARTREKAEKQYSIATVVIDSLSQMNLHRSLPRSVAKAEAMGGILFSGFHRVGEDSKANMLAMTTGSSKNKKGRPMQPLIQGLYHNLGWKTVYFHDIINAWRSLRSEGMSHDPWDLTYHNVWDYLKGSHNHQSQLLNVWDLLLAYKDIPSYIHTHITEYVHDNLNMGKNHDADLVALLNDLSAKGALEETFFLLMGDHGFRQGRFPSTNQGTIENNMPGLIIIPPANFAKDHPNLHANMRANADMLTSMFDIHHMLRQVLNSFMSHSSSLLSRFSPWRATRKRCPLSTPHLRAPVPLSLAPSAQGAALRQVCPCNTAAALRAMLPFSPHSWRVWPGPPSTI